MRIHHLKHLQSRVSTPIYLLTCLSVCVLSVQLTHAQRRDHHEDHHETHREDHRVTRQDTSRSLSHLLKHNQTPLTGAWMGRYTCNGEEHEVLLKLTEGIRGRLNAELHAIYSDELYSSFKLSGLVAQGKRRLRLNLTPETWIERAHADLVMVGLQGRVKGSEIQGKLEHSQCGAFRVSRMRCGLTSSSPCSREARGVFAAYLKRDGSLRERRVADRRRIAEDRRVETERGERGERVERRERRERRRRVERRERTSELTARVFEGERCPTGWRHATHEWVRRNQESACRASGMEEWHVARIAGGGSQDGWGYECESRRSDRRQLGHSLCVQ